MSTQPQIQNTPQPDKTGAWNQFLIQLRYKALPHIKKHFHDTQDQEDVLSDLMLNFFIKLLKNKDARTLAEITPDPNEQSEYLAFIKDRVIDIDRKINGRQRIPTQVKRKSNLEQQVYKKSFMQKVTVEQIINELCSDGKIDKHEILSIIEALEKELGARARQRAHGAHRQKEIYVGFDSEPDNIDDGGTKPDQLVLDNEQITLLKNAMAQLDAENQLILQYYYLDNMEISAIARFLKLPRYMVTYRINKGIRKIEKYFKKHGLSFDDFL